MSAHCRRRRRTRRPVPVRQGGHGQAAPEAPGSGREGKSTTHLTVADRFGNIVSYTFTIEQTGGSGIVVPGRGFLLNNELTDFNFAPDTANSPAPGKRPRSSMAPTIVFDHGRPGGRARLAGRLDDHHHRAADPGQPHRLRAEPARRDRRAAGVAAQQRTGAGRAAFTARTARRAGSSHAAIVQPEPAEIGAATGIRFLPDGRQQAVAEPTRRGGGARGGAC